MAYTETTTTTYGQRVKKSFGGIGAHVQNPVFEKLKKLSYLS